MRSSSKSRSRNKGSSRNRSVGNIINRVFDSAGPEGKVRGTPQQIIEKYQTLTRDAQLSGDRVAAENFQQHAEHYLRMLNDAQREQVERQAADARNRPGNPQDQGGDGGGQEQRHDQRQERGGQGNGGRHAGGEGDQPDFAPVFEAGDSDSGLVDTPENKAEAKSDGKAEAKSDSKAEAKPDGKPARGRGRTRRSAKAAEDAAGDHSGGEPARKADVAEDSTVS